MRILLASSPTFDPSVGDTFFALAAGATLCIAPRARCLTGGRLWLSPRAFQPRCPPPPSTLRPARSFPPLGQARPRVPSTPVWLLLLSSLIPSLLPRIFDPAEPVAAMGPLRGTVNAPTGPRREPSACRQARDKPPTRIRQAPDANPTSPRRESATRAGCPPPRARGPARLAARRVRNAGRRDRAQVGPAGAHESCIFSS